MPWQRYQRHFLQNILERAPARLEDELHQRLRAVRNKPETREELRLLARKIADDEEELAEWL